MRPLIQEIQTAHTPESLVGQLRGEGGIVLLRSSSFDSPQARYSFVVARPFLAFRSFGSRCEISNSQLPSPVSQIQFGNPWQILDALMARYELLDEIDLPFPLGGAFGYWGYDLKNFTEPKLPRRAVNDLELPDCHVGFYDSLAVFDHRLGKVCIVSTGLNADGSRSEARAKGAAGFLAFNRGAKWNRRRGMRAQGWKINPESPRRRAAVTEIASNLTRADFISAVERAQRYIRAGDIYQVNLSQRLTAQCNFGGWEMFEKLSPPFRPRHFRLSSIAGHFKSPRPRRNNFCA
jgi:para-aminobenzoate synthetase component 1